jgi:murein DD-endopeptidase MepM/ murein hydrolase activator NlpD
MLAATSRWGSRLFPEIRICFRSSREVVLTPRLQAALLSTVLAGTAALAYLGATWLCYEHLAAKREAGAARARAAVSAVEKRLVTLQQQLTVLARDRDQARSGAATLAAEAGALRSRLASAESQLRSQHQTEQALQQQREQTATLAARLQKSENDRVADQATLAKIQRDRAGEELWLASYKASLEQTARELDQLSALRSQAPVRRSRIQLQLGEIWRKLSQIQLPSPRNQLASTASSVAGAAASVGDAGPKAANFGADAVAAVEDTLRSAGVDLSNIMAQLGIDYGEGGPFVPPPKADRSAPAMTSDKLRAIEALARTLPVAAPLTRYEVGSGFGPRIDPFNHRPAFHPGIDMDAPYSSPVYATAPGIVIYAGWLGDYGRVVEIDHGFGIVTLYAHLRQCFVTAGQAVSAQAEIGLVGMTGRSNGPHVHYEVRVDGQPQDPEKFLGLARLLPTTTGRQLTPAAGGSGGSSH